MEPGTKVTLRGLKSKPELNGRSAVVLSHEHSEEAAAGYAKGRVPVKLSDGKTMQVKPESLEVNSGDSASDEYDRACAAAIKAADASAEYDRMCSAAWSAFEQGKVQQAISGFDSAMTLDGAGFTAPFQLGQVYEANEHEIPGALELAAKNYLVAADASAPESAAPHFDTWSHAFVRAANLLKALPHAAKPLWWSPHGLKERCGLILANPQGLAPDSSLLSPAWQVTGHAFEMENHATEAATAYETAAGYEMDKSRIDMLLKRASDLKLDRA